ncbi:hypothetical protein ABTE44_19350, partial [Acinetobacter baumannii]
MSALSSLSALVGQIDLSVIDWSEVGDATVETLAMTGGSLFFTVWLGLPLGILLFLTNRGQLLEQRGLYW